MPSFSSKQVSVEWDCLDVLISRFIIVYSNATYRVMVHVKLRNSANRIRCSTGNETDSELRLVKPVRRIDEPNREAQIDASVLDAYISEKITTIKQQALSGKVVAARAEIQELFRRFPGNPKVLIEFAYIEKRRGVYSSARFLFSRAINILETTGNLGFEYVLAMQGWASTEADDNNIFKARSLFQKSIHAAERTGHHAAQGTVYGLHAWALLEEKVGNWLKARNLLARAASIQPKNAVVHQSRAALEARVYHYGNARHNFRLAVTSDRDDIKCWHARALFEATQHRHPKMRYFFRQCMLIDRKDLHTLQAWAHQESLLDTQKSRARARSLYQKCVLASPRNLHSWQSWALFEQRKGNIEGARVLFQKGLSIDPNNIPCLQAFAHMERIEGNPEAARKLLQKARTVDPHNAPTLMESGLLEHQYGNEMVAREFIKRARQIDKQQSKVKRFMLRSSRKSSQLPRANIDDIIADTVVGSDSE